jgi:hypothetical protein
MIAVVLVALGSPPGLNKPLHLVIECVTGALLVWALVELLWR